MAQPTIDGLTLNVGSGGSELAHDLWTDKVVQVILPAYSTGDGAGNVVMLDAGLPVQPQTGSTWAATQSGSWSIEVSGSVAVTGPLTDAQLRATAVPVSLTSTTITGSVAVTGPLTDTELRASAVPVSVASIPSHEVTNAGTFPVQAAQSGNWDVRVQDGSGTAITSTGADAKQGLDVCIVTSSAVVSVDATGSGDVPITLDGETVAVTGPLTDAELRATAVPVSGTFWQATQPVSAASLPLPTGAATDATLTAIAGYLDTEIATGVGHLATLAGAVTTGVVQVAIVSGAGGGLTDAELRATPVPVSGTFYQATQPVSLASVPSHEVTNAGTFAVQVTSAPNTAVTGPLTNTELRAADVVVSLDGESVAVTGPLTDTELRATAVPVSGTFWQATQPVSGTVTADTELTTADMDTGGGTDTRAVVGLVYAASGGASLVSAANPLPVGGTLLTSIESYSSLLGLISTDTAALATINGYTSNTATSVGVMDDWDESDRCKVNLIAGQAGITAGAGAVAANTPRVTHASDDPAVTALQLIDNAVSGAGFNITQLGGAAVPIGAGTEAAALRVTVATDSTGVLSVDDGGGALTVDGTVTAELSATDNAVLDDIAANQTDASQKTQIVDGSGNVIGSTANALDVNIKSGAGSGGTASDDDADFTAGTTSGTPAMGVYESSPSSVTDGDMGIVGITQTRAMRVSVDNSVTVDLGANNDVTLAVLPDTAAGDLAAMVVDLAALEALATTIDGDTGSIATAAASIDGKITACNTGSIAGTVTANAGTNLNTSALALEAGGNLAGCATLLGTIDADTSALFGCVGGTELQVDVVGSLPAGTNAIGKLAANSGVDIGDVDVTSVVPGTAATNLGKAEDAGHTSGDVGVMALAVRQDAAAALAGTDADYAPLEVDAIGRLHANATDISGQAYDSATLCTVKRFHVAAPSDGDSLIAAVASKKFRILSFGIISISGTICRFWLDDADGTAVFGNSTGFPLEEDSGAASPGFILPHNPHGWFQTATANKALRIQFASGSGVVCFGTYIEVS